jgi:hypothetical protein
MLPTLLIDACGLTSKISAVALLTSPSALQNAVSTAASLLWETLEIAARKCGSISTACVLLHLVKLGDDFEVVLVLRGMASRVRTRVLK